MLSVNRTLPGSPFGNWSPRHEPHTMMSVTSECCVQVKSSASTLGNVAFTSIPVVERSGI